MQKLRAAGEACGSAFNSFGFWLLSIIATLGLPCLPLFIEWLRAGQVKNDTITLTAAVLAVGFIFSTENIMCLCAYILLFLVNLLFNTVLGPESPIVLQGWLGTSLLAVTLLHAIERFWWHVVLDRPFPDRIRSLLGTTGQDGQDE